MKSRLPKLYTWVLMIGSIMAMCGLPFAPSFAQTSSAKPNTPKQAASSAQTKRPAAKLIDINSATPEQLKTLPGISDVYAQKIVDNRPYRVKTDLVRKNVVPQATYDKISGMVIAKQGTAVKPKAATSATPK